MRLRLLAALLLPTLAACSTGPSPAAGDGPPVVKPALASPPSSMMTPQGY